jgi:hypothetical protein
MNGIKKAPQEETNGAFDPATYYPMSCFSASTIKERLAKSCLKDFSLEEQKARIELAAAYRVFAMQVSQVVPV